MKRIAFLFMFVATLIVAAGIFVTGCGGSSGGGEAPAARVDKAMAKNPDIKSGHVDYEVNVDGSGDLSSLSGSSAGAGGTQNFKIGVKGGMDFDNSNAAAPKAKGTITLTGLSELMGQMSQASDSSGLDLGSMSDQIGSLLKDMEFVSVDSKLYLKLMGTWYDMGDSSSLSDLGGMGGIAGMSGAGSSLGTATTPDTQCIENAMKDPAKFGSDKFFKNLSEAGSEKIDGTDTTHYKAEVDIEKAMAAITDISKSCGQPEAAGGLEGGSAQIGKMFKTTSVEIWIDGDNNTRQVKLSMEVDPAAVSEATSALGGSLGGTSTSTDSGLKSLKIDVSAKLSRLGDQFDIQKPEGQISKIEDLMGGLTGLGGLGSSSGLGDTSSLGGLSGLEGLGGNSGTSTDSGFGNGSDIATPGI